MDAERCAVTATLDARMTGQMSFLLVPDAGDRPQQNLCPLVDLLVKISSRER